MKAVRDMTKHQFVNALRRHGMKLEGFMGYVDLGLPGRRHCVSHLNAGPKFRRKLAYLLEAQERELAKMETEAGL